jgi:hypothetical protein
MVVSAVTVTVSALTPTAREASMRRASSVLRTMPVRSKVAKPGAVTVRV